MGHYVLDTQYTNVLIIAASLIAYSSAMFCNAGYLFPLRLGAGAVGITWCSMKRGSRVQ